MRSFSGRSISIRSAAVKDSDDLMAEARQETEATLEEVFLSLTQPGSDGG